MPVKYDYLIVGTGLFGSVFAYEMGLVGKTCLMIDKRDHIGGNAYCKFIEDVWVHQYGAHIFHTSNKFIWEYVNRFAEFNRYTNSPVAVYKDKIYNLPFNMNTFYQLWGVKTPHEAKMKIREQTMPYADIVPRNLEEQALKLVGEDIYFRLIKGYTEKQWGCLACELPAFIIQRLPIRFNFDNNYFNDLYQGIPVGGYNQLFAKWLVKADVNLRQNFNLIKDCWRNIAHRLVFTGMIDEYFDYCFGELAYRSLDFEHRVLDVKNYQGNAVVNYTDVEIPYTRIIEHKHFEFGCQDKTIVTWEYPRKWNRAMEAYYPINDPHNQNVLARYKVLAEKEKDVIFGGRLAQYQYFDMHHVIEQALATVKAECEKM